MGFCGMYLGDQVLQMPESLERRQGEMGPVRLCVPDGWVTEV
jgi:hypothetical protein